MSQQLVIAFSIDVLLALVSAFFLIQPTFVFGSKPGRVKKIFSGLGLFFLCMVFCWSFIIGSYVALKQFSIHI